MLETAYGETLRNLGAIRRARIESGISDLQIEACLKNGDRQALAQVDLPPRLLRLLPIEFYLGDHLAAEAVSLALGSKRAVEDLLSRLGDHLHELVGQHGPWDARFPVPAPSVVRAALPQLGAREVSHVPEIAPPHLQVAWVPWPLSIQVRTIGVQAMALTLWGIQLDVHLLNRKDPIKAMENLVDLKRQFASDGTGVCSTGDVASLHGLSRLPKIALSLLDHLPQKEAQESLRSALRATQSAHRQEAADGAIPQLLEAWLAPDQDDWLGPNPTEALNKARSAVCFDSSRRGMTRTEARRAARTTQLEEGHDRAAEEEEPFVTVGRAEEVEVLLGRLSEGERQVFTEKYFEGLTFAQMAGRHGGSTDRFKKIHSRALSRLKGGLPS